MSEASDDTVREATICNKEGLHTRPVMRFVDLASGFQADIVVMNITRSRETVDGKSAMQLITLEATHGCVLRIEATGKDAHEAVVALADLVETGFGSDASQSSE